MLPIVGYVDSSNFKHRLHYKLSQSGTSFRYYLYVHWKKKCTLNSLVLCLIATVFSCLLFINVSFFLRRLRSTLLLSILWSLGWNLFSNVTSLAISGFPVRIKSNSLSLDLDFSISILPVLYLRKCSWCLSSFFQHFEQTGPLFCIFYIFQKWLTDVSLTLFVPTIALNSLLLLRTNLYMSLLLFPHLYRDLLLQHYKFMCKRKPAWF